MRENPHEREGWRQRECGGGGSCANYVHDSVRAEGREGASKQASKQAVLSFPLWRLCLIQKRMGRP